MPSSLKDLNRIRGVLLLLQSLLHNPYIQLELYVTHRAFIIMLLCILQ